MEQEIKVQDTKRDDIKKVDPRNIEVEAGFNKRKDYGDIMAMALSVVQSGVIEPVMGYKKRGEDKYVLTDGHRRMEGVNLAIKLHNEGDPRFADISKIEFIRLIPCSADIKERLYIMAITGEGKKPLTDLEKADMYTALLEIGKEEGKAKGAVIKEIVTKLGVSQATVYNILGLAKLPEEIRTAIGNGEISGSTVSAIVREVKDAGEQISLVNKAIAAAQKAAEVIGGGNKTKATLSNVEGLTAKPVMQRLKEIAAIVEEEGAKNVRANVLVELIAALEDKKDVKKIAKLFL